MKIGKPLREFRVKAGMTLDELSERSGVALATLSRIENDKMTGTLESHTKICKALNISIVELYKTLEEEAKTVESVPGKERTEHFVHANNARYELLVSKVMDKKIMPLMIIISPGGSTQKERNGQGVEKFTYMLEGSLEATVAEKIFSLRKGDSLYFDASLPHSFKNKGKIKAEAICVITPPAL